MIVEITLGGYRPVFFGDDRIDEFLGGGFAITSCKRNNLCFAMAPVVGGQLLKCSQNIVAQNGSFRGFEFFFIYYGKRGAFVQGLLRKCITIEIGPLKGKEQTVFGNFPSVRTYCGVLQKQSVQLFHCHKSKIKKSPDLLAGAF